MSGYQFNHKAIMACCGGPEDGTRYQHHAKTMKRMFKGDAFMDAKSVATLAKSLNNYATGASVPNADILPYLMEYFGLDMKILYKRSDDDSVRPRAGQSA